MTIAAGHEYEGMLVGARLGPYRLVRLIGAGGMGVVYEAHGDDGGKFAIKVIREQLTDSHGIRAVQRFVREAKATSRVVSPHVTRVLDAGADGARHYIVMELLGGRDLADVLRANGPLQPAGIIPVFVQACRGLAAAHACGIVHRDIKPANVFLHETGGDALVVKICDFGIAKQTLPHDPSLDLTSTGGVVGSPMYMSPEQTQNAKDVDLRTDLFSLGVSLYEALTGRRPWGESTVGELILAICTREPANIASVAPWIQPALAAVVHRALARRREDRFASAEELAAALGPLGEATPSLRTLRGITADQHQMLTLFDGSASANASPITVGGSSMAAARAVVSPSSPVAKRRSARWAVPIGLAAVALVGPAAVRRLIHRPLAQSWTATRPTIAVLGPSMDVRAPCLPWLPRDLAEGLTVQLAADSKVRALGPRDLAGVESTATTRQDAFRAFGADAFVEATCAGRAGDPQDTTLRVRVLSTKEGGGELASFRVTGSARDAGDLAARLAEEVRGELGIVQPDAEEVRRASRAVPTSPEGASAYVEGLTKFSAYDALGAKGAFEHAIADEPAFALAHSALAEVLAYLGAQRDAAKERGIAAEKGATLPNEARLVLEGDAAFASSAWDQAIETYRAVLRVFPDRSDVALKLAKSDLAAGRSKDARTVLDELLPRSGGDPRVRSAVAEALSSAGDYPAALDAAEEARTVAKALGLPEVEVNAAVLQCTATHDASALAPDGVCARAEELATKLGDRAAIARVLLAEVYLLTTRSELDRAEALCARVIDLASGMGSRSFHAQVLIARSNIAASRENLKEAVRLAQEAADEGDASGNIYVSVSARMDVAASLQDAGDVDAAGRAYLEALPMARSSGHDAYTAVILQNLAIYWMNKGEIGRARESATESLGIEERIGDEFDQPWTLDELATDEVESNEPERAKTHVERALALREKLKLPTDPSRKVLASTLLRLKDVDGALREVKAVYDSAVADGNLLYTADAGLLLAQVLIARGDPKAALARMGESEAAAAKLGEDPGISAPTRALALLLLSRVHEAQEIASRPSKSVIEERAKRLVRGELLVRAGRRGAALGDLQALASEAHAAGHASVEEAANSLIAGKVGTWYR